MTETSTIPSFEHFVLPGGIRLGVNSNRKLKTVLVKVYMAADLDETVTQHALLPAVLRRGTRSYPDMQALHRRLDGLYGAAFHANVSKVGEWHITRYQLEVVNDLFLPRPEDLFGDGLRLLREVLLEPHLVKGRFDEDIVAQERENLRRLIESLFDDKGAWAAHRCIEEMCRYEPYRFDEHGRIEDLTGIDAGTLCDAWRRWSAVCPISIYVAGDVDVGAVRRRVEEVFRLDREEVRPLRGPPPPVPVGDVREVREKLDVQQAKLVCGFRHGVTYGSEDYEALLVANGILGGYAHSKLFQNVREKASLAYSASSWLEKTKGLLFLACGIAPENYERALAISLEQVEALRRGDITQDELDSTIRTILNQNVMLEDSFSNLAAVDYVWGLHGRPLDLGRFRERLRRVTVDDIVSVARRFEHDTTYFLHG